MRQGLAGRADHLGQLLLRQARLDEHAARGLDTETARQVDELARQSLPDPLIGHRLQLRLGIAQAARKVADDVHADRRIALHQSPHLIG